ATVRTAQASGVQCAIIDHVVARRSNIGATNPSQPRLGEKQRVSRASFRAKRDEKTSHRHRRLLGTSGEWQLKRRLPPTASFNYQIGRRKDGGRNFNAQRFGSLEVDRQVESDGLLNRQVRGFSSLQNPVYVIRAAKEQIREVWPVRYEAAGRHCISCLIHAWQT